ncbi:hypothetical protein COB28_02935 [Candidatus Dependentiae bacterium]|nr:MAG: hypothetical protein COB28_02935 [Candidatus Dependentiae bacterium]
MKQIRNRILLFSLIFFSVGCFSNKAANFDGLISQEISSHSLINEVINGIKSAIDIIVSEELNRLNTDLNKKNLATKVGMYWKESEIRLTLCYLTAFQKKAIKETAQTIEDIGSTIKPGTTFFSPEVAFFGKNSDNLVIKIDDSNSYLSKLNQALKETFHQKHALYQKEQGSDLYSIEKSEQFPYVPHVHIGWLYIRSKATPEERKILTPALQIMFERIKKEIFPIAQKIIRSSKNRVINITFLSYLNLTERKLICTKKLQ